MEEPGGTHEKKKMKKKMMRRRRKRKKKKNHIKIRKNRKKQKTKKRIMKRKTNKKMNKNKKHKQNTGTINRITTATRSITFIIVRSSLVHGHSSACGCSHLGFSSITSELRRSLQPGLPMQRGEHSGRGEMGPAAMSDQELAEANQTLVDEQRRARRERQAPVQGPQAPAMTSELYQQWLAAGFHAGLEYAVFASQPPRLKRLVLSDGSALGFADARNWSLADASHAAAYLQDPWLFPSAKEIIAALTPIPENDE